MNKFFWSFDIILIILLGSVGFYMLFSSLWLLGIILCGVAFYIWYRGDLEIKKEITKLEIEMKNTQQREGELTEEIKKLEKTREKILKIKNPFE